MNPDISGWLRSSCSDHAVGLCLGGNFITECPDEKDSGRALLEIRGWPWGRSWRFVSSRGAQRPELGGLALFANGTIRADCPELGHFFPKQTMYPNDTYCHEIEADRDVLQFFPVRLHA